MAEAAAEGDPDSVAGVRRRARAATRDLIQNFKLRTAFGIRTADEYTVAVQTGGALPRISPDELPPRFEQYVVVEATINVEGQVIDAHIVTGAVDDKIQHRLLSAIREFKYVPAKRNGIPIPYQVDIVVHVPS